MENNNEKKDYIIRLDKARKKRSKNDYKKLLAMGGTAVLCVAVISAVGMAVKNHLSAKPAGLATGSEATAIKLEESAGINAEAESEAQAAKEKDEKEKVVNSYKNLGIIQVSGYLNVRKAPGTEE
ncbi:MAG: hydrolase Nlp/P60, partial [Lacrimispora sphenoides]